MGGAVRSVGAKDCTVAGKRSGKRAGQSTLAQARKGTRARGGRRPEAWGTRHTRHRDRPKDTGPERREQRRALGQEAHRGQNVRGKADTHAARVQEVYQSVEAVGGQARAAKGVDT